MAYIYKITNNINGKIYIGKTQFSIEKRFSEHLSDAFRPTHEKRPLYSAIRKYGKDSFFVSLIEETDFPEEREKYWIETLGSFKNGYNATLGGDGRPYIDHALVVNTYNKVFNMQEVSRIMGISVDTVRNILNQQNIPIKDSSLIAQENSGIMIDMYTKNNVYMQSFPSMRSAAQYLIDEQLTKCNLKGIRYHISEVCHGKRKSAAGFIWRFQ